MLDLSALRMSQRRQLTRVLSKLNRSENPTVRRWFLRSRDVVRDTARVFGRQVGWVAHLQSARWIGPTAFELRGWAYERGHGHPDRPPDTQVWLQSGSHRVYAAVEPVLDPDVNGRARTAQFDYANTAFVARFDLAGLRAYADDPAVVTAGWVTRVRVRGDGRDRTGPFRSRDRFGSARHLFTHTLADTVQLRPQLHRDGIRFDCGRPVVMARSAGVAGRRFCAVVESAGPVLVGASIRTGEALFPLSLEVIDERERPRRYRVHGYVPTELPPRNDGTVPLSVRRPVVLHAEDGSSYSLSTSLDDAAPDLTADSSVLLTAGANGTLILRDAASRFLIDTCTIRRDPYPGLVLRGRYRLGWLDQTAGAPTLSLTGPRQALPLETDLGSPVGGQGQWSAFAPLLVSEWGRPALPPRPGSYSIRARSANGSVIPISAVPAVTVQTPQPHDFDTFRLRLQAGRGRTLRILVSPPRRPDELGSFHQRRLERDYRERIWEPAEAVYFESFYGRAATCNPAALDAEIARRHPQLRRWWGVEDASIAVPEGATAVIRGTHEWWHARGSARYVIANDWLRRQFSPQPFQVVLQTWHGSMLKRIGLDRPNLLAAKLRAIAAEQAKWDALLSQNRYSTEILRSAYAWDKEMFEEGYPRNDPLSRTDGRRIREQLGIAPDQIAVLYAPTWRENLTGMVTFLNLEQLIGELGPEYVILLRGHSRTVAFGERVDLPGVLDVTTYPEVTELFLAADALITDYSSVMFDFSVTRRPMIFFVPDMADYRDSQRGVYFDLPEVAPGPVLSTQDEVLTAIRELDQAPLRYAGAYQSWVERFNHLDDGRAAQRVVDRLLTLRKD